MAKKSGSKVVSVRVYFSGVDGQKFYDRLDGISKRTTLSISKIAGMALRFGIERVEAAFSDDRSGLAVAKSKK